MSSETKSILRIMINKGTLIHTGCSRTHDWDHYSLIIKTFLPLHQTNTGNIDIN